MRPRIDLGEIFGGQKLNRKRPDLFSRANSGRRRSGDQRRSRSRDASSRQHSMGQTRLLAGRMGRDADRRQSGRRREKVLPSRPDDHTQAVSGRNFSQIERRGAQARRSPAQRAWAGRGSSRANGRTSSTSHASSNRCGCSTERRWLGFRVGTARRSINTFLSYNFRPKTEWPADNRISNSKSQIEIARPLDRRLPITA